MTHSTQGAEVRPVPALCRAHPSFSRLYLQQAIADRRARYAALEAALVAACEREAAHGADRTAHLGDRGTWDRAMWDRYLAAAVRREPDFMPAMWRLLDEIGRLERLLALPLLQETAPGPTSTTRMESA